MKDPDGPYECIRDAANDSLEAVANLSPEERDCLKEKRTEELTKFASKWLKWGEYVTVEFDTESGTATVIAEHP